MSSPPRYMSATTRHCCPSHCWCSVGSSEVPPSPRLLQTKWTNIEARMLCQLVTSGLQRTSYVSAAPKSRKSRELTTMTDSSQCSGCAAPQVEGNLSLAKAQEFSSSFPKAINRIILSQHGIALIMCLVLTVACTTVLQRCFALCFALC